MNTQYYFFNRTIHLFSLSGLLKPSIFLMAFFTVTNIFGQQAGTNTKSPTATKTSVSNGNWSDAANWTPSGVPSATDDVFIDHIITVDQANVSCHNLMINSGKRLRLNTNLFLSGNFTNHGILIANSGTVSFNGAAVQYILGSAETVFSNVVIDNAAGVFVNADQLTTLEGTLTINPGKKLIINPDKFLTVKGIIYNNYGGTNGGVEGLILKSSIDGTGSLIHNTDNVPATIERYIMGDVTQTAKRYHQVSLPFNSSANPVSGIFEGSYLFRFEESAGSTGDWVGFGSSTSTPLNVNSGYLIYYVQPSGSMVYNFEGQMRNGTIRIPGPTGSLPFTDAAHGYNLVPNPYPSAIDWRASTGWTKTQINNAIYIWNPNLNQYASYVSGTGNNDGSRYIAQGQAFFIRAESAAASLTINNNARVHINQSTQPFFKSSGEDSLNVFRLKSQVLSESDETTIRFIPGAFEYFDSELDALKFWGGTDAPQLYSVSSDKQNLSINSLSVNAGVRIIPIEFNYSKSAEITFTASGLESFVSSMPVYLEDFVLNKTINLRLQPVYKFNYIPGQKNRFQLRFDNTNGKDESKPEYANIFYSNRKIIIDLPEFHDERAHMQLFDIAGRMIKSCSFNLNGITQFEAPFTTGVYIVRVQAGNRLFTQKIIVN